MSRVDSGLYVPLPLPGQTTAVEAPQAPQSAPDLQPAADQYSAVDPGPRPSRLPLHAPLPQEDLPRTSAVSPGVTYAMDILADSTDTNDVARRALLLQTENDEVEREQHQEAQQARTKLKQNQIEQDKQQSECDERKMLDMMSMFCPLLALVRLMTGDTPFATLGGDASQHEHQTTQPPAPLGMADATDSAINGDSRTRANYKQQLQQERRALAAEEEEALLQAARPNLSQGARALENRGGSVPRQIQG